MADPNDKTPLQSEPDQTEQAPPVAPRKPRKPRSSTKAKGPKGLVLPTLVVEDLLVFPNLTVPYPVEDDETAYAIELACRNSKRQIFLVCERPIKTPESAVDEQVDTTVFKEFFANLDLEQPEDGSIGWVGDGTMGTVVDYELCPIGIIAEIGQFAPAVGRVPRVMLQGLSRGIVMNIVQEDPAVVCEVLAHPDPVVSRADAEAPMEALNEQIENYVALHPGVPGRRTGNAARHRRSWSPGRSGCNFTGIHSIPTPANRRGPRSTGAAPTGQRHHRKAFDGA